MIVRVFVFCDCPLEIDPFLPVTILHSHLISRRKGLNLFLHHIYIYIFFSFLAHNNF